MASPQPDLTQFTTTPQPSTFLNLSTQFMLNLTLLQYLYMTFTCTLSLIIFGRFYWISRKQVHKKLSMQLRIHLYAWTFFCFISLCHFGPGIFMYKGEARFTGAQYNLVFVALKSTASFSALIIAPLSSMAVTIDRICALSFVALGHQTKRIFLHKSSIFILTSGYIFVFVVMGLRIWDVNFGVLTSCLTLTCLNKNNQRDFVWAKLLFGCANFILGSIFIYLYYAYGRNLAVRREKRKNFVALLILINEMVFNLIPTALYLFIYVNSVAYVSGALGSIMSFAYCTDGLCTSLVFYFTWKDRLATVGSNQVMPFKSTNLNSRSTPMNT